MKRRQEQQQQAALFAQPSDTNQSSSLNVKAQSPVIVSFDRTSNGQVKLPTSTPPSSIKRSSVQIEPLARSDSPDLALLGARSPPPLVQDSSRSPTSPVPEYLERFTQDMAGEVRALMEEVGQLREEKRSLQYQISGMMRDLSGYSPGEQYNQPAWNRSRTSPPERARSISTKSTPASPTTRTSTQPVRPGWRTVHSEQKRSNVQSNSAIETGRSAWTATRTSNRELPTVAQSSAPRQPRQTMSLFGEE
ncbi:hypothetical protein FRB95_005370 [Tulasnella sp. JGI-2019a]|nr:hypothetical protein FRB95_005370 [Tulasnella sp. JGI-2019a]